MRPWAQCISGQKELLILSSGSKPGGSLIGKQKGPSSFPQCRLLTRSPRCDVISHEGVKGNLGPMAASTQLSRVFTVPMLGPGASQAAPAHAGDIRDVGSIPGSGRSSGGGHGNPLQYSCLKNSLDRGAWRATVHRSAKSQTQLSTPTKEGKGHIHI